MVDTLGVPDNFDRAGSREKPRPADRRAGAVAEVVRNDNAGSSRGSPGSTRWGGPVPVVGERADESLASGARQARPAA